MPALAAAGAALLGGQVRDSHPLAGGDLSPVLLITLQDGRSAVVKGGPAPTREAEMLKAIAAARVPVPPVLAFDDQVLVLAHLPSGGALQNAWESLGRILARLHATVGGRYGWGAPYAFGAVTIENTAADAAGSWPDFWADRRLRVHLPHVSKTVGQRIEALCARLGDVLPAQPPAALLHGDLWTGNVLVNGGKVSGLIDPACYFGHAEVDIAMLSLFDRPEPAFFAAYGALPPGHEERLAIYGLWPALVHLRVFGSGYAASVNRLLSRAGA